MHTTQNAARQTSAYAPTPAQPKLQRVATLTTGATRLSRRLGPVHPFPASITLSGKQIRIIGAPELILLVDLYRPAEGEYRLRFFHDVIVQIMLAHGDDRCVINVNLISSRLTPSTEAALVDGWVLPGWLNLGEADDVMCALPIMAHIKHKFTDSIADFIKRWITEYSLKAIKHLRDEEVTSILQARDKIFYQKIIDYLDHLPGANVDTISNHVRTALVAADEMAALIAAQPKRAEHKSGDSFERTQELRSERLKRA